MRHRLLIASLIVTAPISFASERVTLTGRVTDNLGKPLEDATVMVYHAGVKKGYSTFCPSCYADCGKRTVTDRTGSFTIKSLDPDLWFELLVIRDGYTATFVKKVDPSRGPADTAALAPRADVDDPSRVVRGRVVDPFGEPLRAAVVVPEGVAMVTEDGPTSVYGTPPGLEPVAVTNPKGEFELAYSKKATGMLLLVEARGMSAKLIAVPTGAERNTITVSDGAVIRGRLMNQGKPVAGAELGLIARPPRGFGANLKLNGNPYEEIRIGTEADGSFVITNVPTPVDWYVYGKMESIAALGATDPVECATARDGEEVNVGDIQIHPGYRLRGKVTLSDGAAIADGMRVTISAERAWDNQTVIIGRDGRFEFAALPAGKYEIFTSVRGYRMQGNQPTIEIAIDRDKDDFAITLDPAARR
jgi:Carboxypeptidase regulatory-like domain